MRIPESSFAALVGGMRGRRRISGLPRARSEKYIGRPHGLERAAALAELETE